MKPGQRIRIARNRKNQFQSHAMDRQGHVVRVRGDGLIVVRWDGLSSEQVFADELLEVLETQ